MVRLVGLAVGFLMTAHGICVAAPSEMEQRTACITDAVRLCADKIPNRAAIEACMAVQHDQLSRGCMVVFDASRAAERSRLR